MGDVTNAALCDFAMRWKLDGDYLRCVECTSCGASGPEMARNASDAEYIHVWNSRYTPPPPPSVGAVRQAWRAAITLANNICVQESDDHNSNDSSRECNATSECAKRIRDYVDIEDAQLVELLEENGATCALESFASRMARGGERDAVLKPFVASLHAFADQQYIRALDDLRRDPCLGWEHKVKAGKFGEAEFNAHKVANQFMGAHYGIYNAVRAALAAHTAGNGGGA